MTKYIYRKRTTKEQDDCEIRIAWKEERKKMTRQLRWAVLERDNHRCVSCGRTPITSTLHVDHIVPVSRGGKTDLSNLQTLCSLCNYGKGDL